MVERIQRGSETLSYISSPDGLVAMHISDDNGRDEMKYVLTDYLGTIYAFVDDGAQSTEDALYYSFNAWGERRELQAYDVSLTAPLFSDPADYITSRGYTGHEHIDAFDLINLNGRAYDPVVGAFLSPDPYVQAPDMPQNLNRYAYCLNNPLKYTDPSGEFIHLIAGAVLGGFMNWMMGGCQFNLDGLAQFGIGAIAGAAGAGVGVGIKTASAGASFWAGFVGSPLGINTILQVGYTSSFFNGAISGAGAGFTSGSISGFGNGIVQGDSFGDALANGLKIGAWSAAIAGINGGISEGLEAISNNKNFWTGKYILQQKLDIMVEKNINGLTSEIGEAGVSEIKVGTNRNIKGTGYRSRGGSLYNKKGQKVAGFHSQGKGFALSTDGHVRISGNRIFLSKNTVKTLWDGDLYSREVLFHEWFHARDLYSGYADYLNKKYIKLPGRYEAMMEFRAHSFNFSHFPNRKSLMLMEHYSRLFHGMNGLF